MIGKEEEPTVIVIDNQLIKNSKRGALDKGFDGHKRIQGRKRHIETDSNGRLLSCMEGGANEHDAAPAKWLIEKIKGLDLPNLKFIVADGAYTSISEWAKETFGIEVHISKQIKEKKFVPIAHRWKVERYIS